MDCRVSISMQVSVIICAYTMQRWSDICEAIESLSNQTRLPEEIVLVVDHNDELLARARAAFETPVRVVANQCERGLSGGRNTGIAVAKGELLGFLDDDAVAAPDWLEILIDHCAAPHVLGVTCRVVPQWRGVPPVWFPEEFMWTVGCYYRGLPEQVGAVRNVFGGAMLAKREVFDAIGGMTGALGRSGKSLISCEDTEMCIRARAAFPGHEFLIVPNAEVFHKVPADRLTWHYYLRRCFAEGKSKGYLRQIINRSGTLDTERSYVLRILSTGVLRGVRRGGRNGFGNATAILVGLGAAACGYTAGALPTRRQLQSPPAIKTAGCP